MHKSAVGATVSTTSVVSSLEPTSTTTRRVEYVVVEDSSNARANAPMDALEL
jgi:hypothetical protein